MKPNILLILADQFRYDCIGAVGKNPIKTPNIDKLIDEGVFYKHAYTPVPVCAPARQSLLSGRQADSFGSFWNYDLLSAKSCEKGDYWTTELRKIGYNNAYIGKWNTSQTNEPEVFGFNKYISISEYNKYLSDKNINPKLSGNWFGENNSVDINDSKTHWLAENTIKTIEEFEKEPNSWHIRLDFTDPHLPCCPSKPFSDMYNPEDLPEWDSFGDMLENKPYIQRQQLKNWNLEGMNWQDWQPCVSRYYGMISQLDDALGRIFEKLEQMNIIDETLIIFTSDHGDTCGGHGMIDKHYILYDDVTRVPLVVRYPKLFEKGKSCEHFVSNCLDIAPTIEEIIDLPVSGKRHGQSLLKTLNGDITEDFSISSSNGQQFGLFTQRCIRTHEYKYIWNPTDIDEFYELTRDFGEKVNEIHNQKYSSIVSDLRKKLFDALQRRDDPFASFWLKDQLLNDKKI